MNSGFRGAGCVSSPSQRRVWLLLGKYGGDNAQLRGIGHHLTETYGWHCETREVRFRPYRQFGRSKMPTAIDLACSDLFDPPWPDIVVSCGRYYGLVAAWLKRQADHAMIHAHLGKIAAPLASFDVIAATAQYGLPPAPNLIPLTLPFGSQDAAQTSAAVAAWMPRLAHLPRPWTVLMVGGPAAKIGFGAAEADQAVARAAAGARQSGGALLTIFSRRTPSALRARMRATLAGLPDLSTWTVDWPPPQPNPYPALLALGDRYVVTCDSASMVADAFATTKPVEVIRFPIADFVTRFSSRGLGLSIDSRRRRRWRQGLAPDALDRWRDTLVARNLMRPWEEVEDHLHVLGSRGLLAAAERGTDAAQRIRRDEMTAFAARIEALVAATDPATAGTVAPLALASSPAE